MEWGKRKLNLGSFEMEMRKKRTISAKLMGNKRVEFSQRNLPIRIMRWNRETRGGG